ncbi:MAG: hypothetical protein RRY12_01330 [Cloacibacillus sp.]
MANNMLNTCLRTLGVDAVYIRWHERKAVRGIFDANYTEVDPQTGLPVMSVGPVFDMNRCDIPGNGWQEGDRMEIEGVLYEIIEERPDSEHGVSMMLQRVNRQ